MEAQNKYPGFLPLKVIDKTKKLNSLDDYKIYYVRQKYIVSIEPHEGFSYYTLVNGLELCVID